MNIIKRFIVIILFFTFHNLFSQEINIFIIDASSKVDSGYVYNTYTSIGFNEVNIIESDINTSLDTGTYDVAFVAEGHYYDNSIQDWVLDPILEAERQILQNFVEQGGHLVWISENWGI